MTTRKQRSIFVENMLEELATIENDLRTSYIFANFVFTSYAEDTRYTNCKTINVCADYFLTENEANIMTDFIFDICDEIHDWTGFDDIIYRNKITPIIEKFKYYLFTVILENDYPY